MNSRLPLIIGLCALALALSHALPARAEFPPEGATPDAQNPAIATGDYPSSTKGNAKTHYVFYFDCSKGAWIGVAITASGESGSSSPHGREFPPGPPTGAKEDPSDPNHSTNAITHQTFAFTNGVWIDAKSRQVARSAKLCPESAAPSSRHPASEPTTPVKNERPDTLPPPPVIKTEGNSRP
jgi:hypothetical protein